MAHRDDAPQTAGWFTSTYSDNQGGQCVQAQRRGAGPGGKMAVRDSKNPEGGTFEFEGSAWTSFLAFATEVNESSL
ncbi:DUF397 domain-containing protein [Streptomyces virginiae]|uniref:DUF397 domain-containing protein n=1 Tax=Streptomyces virginiae TaxID=1961 RepID=UPI0036C1DDFD